LRAVGAQALGTGSGTLVVFAVNTFQRVSTFDAGELDVLIDLNGDGIPDFAVIGIDLGLLQTGTTFSGQVASAVVNLKTHRARVRFLAVAPTDGTTLLLPALASDFGVTAANPRFTYAVENFDLLSPASDAIPGTARFNAFQPAIGTGAFVTVAPHGSASVPLTIDAAEWAVTPPLGVMVVGIENATRSHGTQAQLVRLPADDDDRHDDRKDK
jgi:hypothetical protein